MASTDSQSAQPWDPSVTARPLEREIGYAESPAVSPFPPIADYGFLSDCEVTALVASSGNVEWMCLPRIDSPSVFGAMLDRGAGAFRLGPSDMTVPAARRYLPGTNVLETSWGTPTGWIIVRDLLLMGPWHHEGEQTRLYRRTPTDYEAEHTLLRTVRCAGGGCATDDRGTCRASAIPARSVPSARTSRSPPRSWLATHSPTSRVPRMPRRLRAALSVRERAGLRSRAAGRWPA